MSNILPKKSWHVYNDGNKEKVRHDEEQDRILKETERQKREQDVRSIRLDLLRKRKAETHTSLSLIDGKSKSEEVGKSQSFERFTLFPDHQTLEHKKTKTQKEVEERESWVKPMELNDIKTKSVPWYAKPKGATGTEERYYYDEPRPPASTKPLSIEDLRRQRLKRECEEREKAERLLRNRR